MLTEDLKVFLPMRRDPGHQYDSRVKLTGDSVTSIFTETEYDV